MVQIPAIWASRLHYLSLSVWGVAALNVGLAWSLFSFWTWGTDLLPSPDKVAGLAVFGLSSLCTLLVATGAAALGFPNPRRGSPVHLYVFKLFIAVALFAGMQVWILTKLVLWTYHRMEALHAPDRPASGNGSAAILGRRAGEL
mmetsp:Transcript_12600/g.25611  ORF Transcript_12600/g.25611 Transcript_12600/m.25611 type:complete len:144 (-) Transcript_12600:164-595(-)